MFGNPRGCLSRLDIKDEQKPLFLVDIGDFAILRRHVEMVNMGERNEAGVGLW